MSSAPGVATESAVSSRFALLRALKASPPLWWAMIYFYCLLTGYMVLRPVRDAMGASDDPNAVFPQVLVEFAHARGFPIEEYTLQILFSLTFIVMVLLQPLYGALVARFPRRVFLPALYVGFMACLFVFHLAFEAGTSGRGAAFFVWVAVFNLFAVSVFWSYLADVFENHDARALYGYIGAAGTIGAMTGPLITRLLVERIGIGNLLLVAAGFLGLCIFCIVQLRPWAKLREQARGETGVDTAIGGTMLAGLRLLLQQPLLRALSMLMFFGVGVGTLLYNEVAAIAGAGFVDDAARTRFYSGIDLAINVLTLLVQLLLTRMLMQRYGIGPLLLIPAIAILLGFSILMASPLPMTIALVLIVTRASEFSLSKPARETIYTRVDPEVRYKSKGAIDTLVYRSGDLSFVWLHKLFTVMGSRVVFVAGAATAVMFAWSAWRVTREQANLAAPSEQES